MPTEKMVARQAGETLPYGYIHKPRIPQVSREASIAILRANGEMV